MAKKKSAPPTPKAAPKPAGKPRDREAERIATLFKQLGDPTRLRVTLMLAEREMFVGEICAGLAQSQPAVSHHLALLRAGGLIESRREGKNNFYTLCGKVKEMVELAQKMSA